MAAVRNIMKKLGIVPAESVVKFSSTKRAQAHERTPTQALGAPKPVIPRNCESAAHKINITNLQAKTCAAHRQ